MKIKTDFITNSSSSAYIIVENTPIQDLDIVDLAYEAGISKHSINKYKIFKGDKVKELQKYNNYGNPLDWIEKITGIKHGKLQGCYEDTLDSVRNNKTVHYFICERGEIDLNLLLGAYDVTITYCEEY